MKINELTEGLYDPHIFKAIFMVGSPGSGKSFVANKIISGTGIKPINIDVFFEKLQTSWKKSSVLATRQRDIFTKSRLGVLIDGTGRNFDRIAMIKEKLDALGYDSALVFVNTDLKTALKRNQDRERTVSINFLKTSHREIQNNIGRFQHLFNPNFIVVDNTEENTPGINEAWKFIRKFINSPPTNPIAKQWIIKQQGEFVP